MMLHLLIFCGLIAVSLGDVPANCTYEQARGQWTFYVGAMSLAYPHTNCSEKITVVNKVKLNLMFPNIVSDEYGNIGFWTMIYNQGFEVVINNRKYFAFFDSIKTATKVYSLCNLTLPGFTHDVLQRQWACYRGEKDIITESKGTPIKPRPYTRRMYKPNQDFVRKINSIQNLWTATHYEQFDGMTIEELTLMSGTRRPHVARPPRPVGFSQAASQIAASLPSEFDWRNVSGTNYVSPVRAQLKCGSCYSFASAGMLEARIRIRTNNTLQPILSPQDVVECSIYSQGCSGGFPYLIAGKYAEDFGFALEECNRYIAKDAPCSTMKNCKRYYATKYRYIGGYYGACTEEGMMLELVHGGPIAVGFEAYPDFKHYKTGVYHHTGLQDHFNPFELTNHAVLVVGYGIDKKTGVKYWTVKNSWGDMWGEKGFFRIRRGNDECNIESESSSSEPVL